MTSTDGLRRGVLVIVTDDPISVPVGTKTLDRIFNILGKTVDEVGFCDARPKILFHRSSPAFTELDTKSAIFETGIKVID